MQKKEVSAAAAPSQKKRHFILAVLGIALLLAIVGQLFGELLVFPIQKLFPNMAGGTVFLLHYLSFIGIDILTLVFCAVWEKDIFRSFLHPAKGGAPGNTGKNFALGLLIGFLINGICILIAWLHGDVHFYAGHFQLLYLLCAFVCVCVQSGAEELVTRGYMMGALRERYNVWVAIAINSLFFAVLHLSNPGITVVSVLEITIIGFALSLIVYYLDSLWMCIAIHTAWNYTQNILLGLPNSGIVPEDSFLHLEAAKGSLLYDATFGIEGSITAVIVTALLAVCVYLYARKRKEQK